MIVLDCSGHNFLEFQFAKKYTINDLLIIEGNIEGKDVL